MKFSKNFAVRISIMAERNSKQPNDYNMQCLSVAVVMIGAKDFNSTGDKSRSVTARSN